MLQNNNKITKCEECAILNDNPVKCLVTDCVKEIKSGIQVGCRALNLLNFNSPVPLINRLALCSSAVSRFAFNGLAMIYSFAGSLLRLFPGKTEELGAKMAADLSKVEFHWDQKEAALDATGCAPELKYAHA